MEKAWNVAEREGFDAGRPIRLTQLYGAGSAALGASIGSAIDSEKMKLAANYEKHYQRNLKSNQQADKDIAIKNNDLHG